MTLCYKVCEALTKKSFQIFTCTCVHGKGIDYKYMYKCILDFKTRYEYY